MNDRPGRPFGTPGPERSSDTDPGSWPGPATSPEHDPAWDMADLLARYAAGTDLTLPDDLAPDIHALIAREPRQTPPRRFLASVRALAPGAALAALRQNLDAVVGRGHLPVMVRAQALGVLLLVALTAGVAGVGGARFVDAVLPGPQSPTPTIGPSPRIEPTSRPTPAPTRAPAGRGGTEAGPTPTPTAVPRSEPTPRGGPPEPHPTPKGGPPEPHPTPRGGPPEPHPTPRGGPPEPHPTPRNDRPHPTPKGSPKGGPPEERPTPRAGRP